MNESVSPSVCCVITMLHQTNKRHVNNTKLKLVFFQEKGNCPLHIAAQANQASQVELLVVYGADPGALDLGGKTPIDYAR